MCRLHGGTECFQGSTKCLTPSNLTWRNKNHTNSETTLIPKVLTRKTLNLSPSQKVHLHIHQVSSASSSPRTTNTRSTLRCYFLHLKVVCPADCCGHIHTQRQSADRAAWPFGLKTATSKFANAVMRGQRWLGTSGRGWWRREWMNVDVMVLTSGLFWEEVECDDGVDGDCVLVV